MYIHVYRAPGQETIRSPIDRTIASTHHRAEHLRVWRSGMTRFVVGSFLLALVELIGFAAYTATHRVEAGVVAVRPDRGGSYGSSALTRAPASRSRSPVPSRQSPSALRDNGASANLNASVRGIKPADPPFSDGSLPWESSPPLPGA